MASAVAPDLTGLWVPIITPFTPDDRVDVAALDRLARRLLDNGCAGLVALGTTGESATLRPQERRQVIGACARVCADYLRPLLVGVGSSATRATIEESRRIEDLVAPAALMVVVPYYTRPSEAAIVDHFRTVATALGTPVVMYNVPYRTGRGLGPSAVLELGEVPGIIGLKQAVGALDHDTLEILARRPPGFSVLAGDDAYIAPTVLMGASGAISAAAHVCTPSFVAMMEAALAGEAARAVKLARALLPVVDAGFADPNPAGWKAALHARGEIASDRLRPPMTSASAETRVSMLAAIASAAI